MRWLRGRGPARRRRGGGSRKGTPRAMGPEPAGVGGRGGGGGGAPAPRGRPPRASPGPTPPPPLGGGRHIRPLIDALAEAEGAVPALPVADTLKRTADGMVTETAAREGLVRAQTPQAFR